MSTRCNIWVDNGNSVVQYYHHWDGYPQGVGNELVTMARMALILTPVRFDIEDHSHHVDVSVLDGAFKKLLSLVPDDAYEAEGADLTVHGDIEYLYYVKLNEDASIDLKYVDWNGLGSASLDWFRKGNGTDLEEELKDSL